MEIRRLDKQIQGNKEELEELLMKGNNGAEDETWVTKNCFWYDY